MKNTVISLVIAFTMLFNLLGTYRHLNVLGVQQANENYNSSVSLTVPQEIKDLLGNYSQSLSSQGKILLENNTNQIQDLVAERQSFYQEFWEKGLHSKLITLDSQFETDTGVDISLTGNTYNLSLYEQVKMYGEPIVKSPDQFPLIQAAKWAISNTSDDQAKNYLYQYIKIMSEGVEQSVRDGNNIVFVTKHDMKVEKVDQKLKLIADKFSDKSSDNKNGFDNGSWTGNKPNRIKPNWLDLPDYQIYNMPIESIGRLLLQDYEKPSLSIKNASTFSTSATSTNSSYVARRDSAVWYIQEYTSNPDYYHWYSCPNNQPDVLRDTNHWNSQYSNVWSYWLCDDCTDYVSQALTFGGFPTDDTWNPGPYVLPWIRVYSLVNYLQSNNSKGALVDNIVSLKVGDLAFIHTTDYADENLNWQHAVMISGVNPYRFSAHTHDRYNYSINSDFNKFMIIKYNNIIFIPFVTSSSYNGMLQSPSNASAYPAPVIPQKSTPILNPYPAP